MLAFATPPPPAPPPPPPPPPAVTSPRPVDVAQNAVPLEAPDKFSTEPPPPPPALTSTIGVPGGIIVSGTLPLGPLVGPPPPAPPPPQKDPTHVGGDIKQPKQLKGCEPVYPAMAVAAKVQGMVIVEAVIDKSGNVKDAHILKHHPLLDDAALAAVRCRQYSPTLLNGIPIEVVFTVTVNFQLGGG
jgi:protein TonB